jgi:predicted CXXCH cytochrome family protein
MLKAESYQDLCISCHADKRGPWIHEHPPVMENCATCHTPHGSAHNRLLAQKPPALCADCHPGGHTHGIYDGRGTLPNTLPGTILSA